MLGCAGLTGGRSCALPRSIFEKAAFEFEAGSLLLVVAGGSSKVLRILMRTYLQWLPLDTAQAFGFDLSKMSNCAIYKIKGAKLRALIASCTGFRSLAKLLLAQAAASSS